MKQKSIFYLIISVLGITSLAWTAGSLRFPAISGDGKLIAFSSQGDIWLFYRDSDRLARLTTNPAFDAYPVFSPDGRHLVFASDRHGNFDLFRVAVDSGIPYRLTFHTASDIPNCWGKEGIIFQSSRYNQVSLYRFKTNGDETSAHPERIFSGYWAIPHHGRISSAGDKLLFTTSWESLEFWWRKGYRGSFNDDVHLYNFKTGSHETLTRWEGNDAYPVWGSGTDEIFYVSDRVPQNIFKIKNGQEVQVSRFSDGYVRWLTAAERVPLLVFERDHTLWLMNTENNKTGPLPISVDTEAPYPMETRVNITAVNHFKLSPDRKKVALISRGEIWVTDREGSHFHRVTETASRESEIQWLKDSRHLIFTSDRNDHNEIYKVDVLSPRKVEKLVPSGGENLGQLNLSPDGNKLAFIEGKKRLKIMELGSGKTRKIYEGNIRDLGGSDYCWAPDSNWIVVGTTFYWEPEMVAVHVESSRSTRLTHNSFSESDYTFSPDGKYIYFSANYTGHRFPDRTGQRDLYLLENGKKEVFFREAEFEKLFEKVTEKDKSKEDKVSQAIEVAFDFTDVEKKITPLTDTQENEFSPSLSGDGKYLAYVKSSGAQQELWLTEIEEDMKLKKSVLVDKEDCPDCSGERVNYYT